MPGLVELVECPYNRSHRIMPQSMPKHLFKCRKNYPKVKLVSCPFNTAHRISSLEIKLHTEHCTDRGTFELYKYCVSSLPSKQASQYQDQLPSLQLVHDSEPSIPVPELIYHNDLPSNETGKTLMDDDECWDDSNVLAYNPQEYCKNAKVIRKATLLKPSEKREFYRKEHIRLKQLNKQTLNTEDVNNGLDYVTNLLSRKLTMI
ncbi:gametocyte-specific factor 1 homolog [Wyeomyia smithii]|uniref:gametocyte-specific factor 1 homolog n=1 Tax=Wyeomyia smithii TaxID=174621 RepID=UPI0024682174|nr:gametocyte-specific factor 1 homolog [Wyeomyia smithii]